MTAHVLGALLAAFTAFTADPSVAWGPIIGGLQLGLAPAESTQFTAGDVAKFEVFIRNVEESAIKFRYHDDALRRWFPRFISDGGFDPPVWLPDVSGARIFEEELDAGESKALGFGWLQLLPLNAMESIAETIAYVTPGDYRVTGIMDIHVSFEETVLLTTGAVSFSVLGQDPEEESSDLHEFTESAMGEALRLLGYGYAVRQRFWRSQPQSTSAGFPLDLKPWERRFEALSDEAIAYMGHIAQYHPDASYATTAGRLLAR